VFKLILLFILFLAIFAAGSVLSLLWRLLSPARRPSPPEKTARGEEMVRDPACGMFLPRRDAVTATIRGTQHFFCSEACRDTFRQAS